MFQYSSILYNFPYCNVLYPEFIIALWQENPTKNSFSTSFSPLGTTVIASFKAPISHNLITLIVCEKLPKF